MRWLRGGSGGVTVPSLPPQGDFVWLDAAGGVPIGAEVTLSPNGELQLVDDEGKVKYIINSNHNTMTPHVQKVEGVNLELTPSTFWTRRDSIKHLLQHLTRSVHGGQDDLV